MKIRLSFLALSVILALSVGSSLAFSQATPLQLAPTKLINLETADVLPENTIQMSYGAHTFPKASYGGGTGLQTYNLSIDGGVTKNLQLGLAWTFFDDLLGEKINGNVTDFGLLVYAPNFKYRIFQDDHYSLAVAGSLEFGRFRSQNGLYTPDNSRKTSWIIAETLQVPLSIKLVPGFEMHLVPGAVIYPDKINDGGKFYGSFFTIGTGFNYSATDRLALFANLNVPIGPGGNSVNSQGQIFRKPVWTAGVSYLQSPTVGIDIYSTNALGATPATQMLTFVPDGDQFSAGVNFRFTPDFGQGYPTSFRNTSSAPLSTREKQLILNGVTLTSANTTKSGMFALQAGLNTAANFQLSYGLSDNAQLEFIGQKLVDTDKPVGTSLKLGAGTKINLLEQNQGDPFSLGLRGSVQEAGSSSDGIGLFGVEMAILYNINPALALMVNPKATFSGTIDIAGVGAGLNCRITDNLQILGEVTPIITGGTPVWATAIRYFYPSLNAGIDLYAKNAIGTHDIGGLIAKSGNRVEVGINLLVLLGR